MSQNKEFEATSIIPLTEFADSPIDIQIRIRPNANVYESEVFAEGRWYKYPINISPSDLTNIGKRLQNAAEKATEDESNLNPGEDLVQLVRELAEVGHYAFKRIFIDNEAWSLVDSITKYRNSTIPISIQITSENFFLPWELLYPENLDKEISCKNFFGAKYIISRAIVQNERPGAFVPNSIKVLDSLQLGLLSNTSLPSVLNEEIPFFENLESTGRIMLSKLRVLDNSSVRTVELNEFKAFWLNQFHVAHFACHVIYDEQDPDLSNFELSDDFSISFQDMITYDVRVNGNPLVILNACHTGNLNPLYTSHFASYFLKQGARGVVATECAIPDELASSFMEVLYKYLLGGETLGRALLKTRQDFLKKNDPSSLLYSMYAPPSIKIII